MMLSNIPLAIGLKPLTGAAFRYNTVYIYSINKIGKTHHFVRPTKRIV